jgi:hypothetical protein
MKAAEGDEPVFARSSWQTNGPIRTQIGPKAA